MSDIDFENDPFAALDDVVFEPKRDKRAAYTGEIPEKVAAIVRKAYESGSIAKLPFSVEDTDKYAPMFNAAATRENWSARVWEWKDGDVRKGINLSVGKRRGVKPSVPTDDATDATDASASPDTD